MTATAATKQTSNPEVAAELRGLVRTYLTADTDRATERAMAAVIVLMQQHARNWSRQFCRVGGDVTLQHIDDVVSVCVERMIVMLKEARDLGRHAEVDNWYAYLYGSCRYAALAYFHSPEVTPASGMTAVMRRQRHVARTRNELRARLGREPKDDEIIEAANAKMRERRSNPEKQGALVDVSDLTVVLPATDIADYDRAAESDDAAAITPVEGRMLVQFIVDAAAEVSPQMATAARAWIGGMYAEPPRLGSVADIAEQCEVSTQRATRIVALLRDLAREVTQSEFGVALPV